MREGPGKTTLALPPLALIHPPSWKRSFSPEIDLTRWITPCSLLCTDPLLQSYLKGPEVFPS
jgi:hypothetical protein